MRGRGGRLAQVGCVLVLGACLLFLGVNTLVGHYVVPGVVHVLGTAGVEQALTATAESERSSTPVAPLPATPAAPLGAWTATSTATPTATPTALPAAPTALRAGR